MSHATIFVNGVTANERKKKNLNIARDSECEEC